MWPTPGAGQLQVGGKTEYGALPESPLQRQGVGIQEPCQNDPFRGKEVGIQEPCQNHPFRCKEVGIQEPCQNDPFRGKEDGIQEPCLAKNNLLEEYWGSHLERPHIKLSSLLLGCGRTTLGDPVPVNAANMRNIQTLNHFSVKKPNLPMKHKLNNSVFQYLHVPKDTELR